MNAAFRPERPRILHIVNNLDSGGMERNLLAVAQQTGDRFDHRICCIRTRGRLADHFEAAAIKVTALEATGRDVSVALRLAQHCRRLRPHVVHTRNWGALDGIIGARLARVPAVIHSEHGWDVPTLPRRRAWILRALAPWIDTTVAVSEHLRSYLCNHVGIEASKLSLIRNGVDAVRFRPAVDRERLRRELGLDSDKAPIVLAVGRLESVKNHSRLVAAFAGVRRRQPTARLVIVGDGPERRRVEEETARQGLDGVVRLVGHCDRVELWLAAADVFTHPSHFEGMANAALEAMAASLPVVATRVGGSEEIVVDGVTGRLVPSNDENALTEALADYCGDAQARVQHGEAGRRRVLAEFTAEAMTSAYADLYERVVAGRNGASAPA